MKILAIDTTTKFLCLGIYVDGKLFEYNLEVDRKLSLLINITIKRVLDTLSLVPQELDYFAAGIGPGSFTGVRTGISVIKGMSWALNKPVIGISTLDILAKNAGSFDGLLAPVIDAKRGLIYSSLYTSNKGRIRKIIPYALHSPEAFFGKIQKGAFIFGDALLLYKELILRNAKDARILDRDYWYPKARNIIELALERIEKKKIDSAFTIEPDYLYPKECQIILKAKHLSPNT